MLTTCDHWSHQVKTRCKQTQVSVRFSWRSDTDRVCPPEMQTRCRRGVKGEKDKNKERKVTWGQIRDNYTCIDNTENKRLHVCVLMAERGGEIRSLIPVITRALLTHIQSSWHTAVHSTPSAYNLGIVLFLLISECLSVMPVAWRDMKPYDLRDHLMFWFLLN